MNEKTILGLCRRTYTFNYWVRLSCVHCLENKENNGTCDKSIIIRITYE